MSRQSDLKRVQELEQEADPNDREQSSLLAEMKQHLHKVTDPCPGKNNTMYMPVDRYLIKEQAVGACLSLRHPSHTRLLLSLSFRSCNLLGPVRTPG